MNLRLIGFIGAGLVVLALIAGIFAHFRNDARLQQAHEKLSAEAETVLIATQRASGNDDLKWEQVAGQVTAMGESNGRLKMALDTQNQRIDQMAEEAVRLRAEASELRKIVDRARRQRAAALARLSDMAATPGTREDCMILLEEAERALDLVKEAGL